MIRVDYTIPEEMVFYPASMEILLAEQNPRLSTDGRDGRDPAEGTKPGESFMAEAVVG